MSGGSACLSGRAQAAVWSRLDYCMRFYTRLPGKQFVKVER